MNEQELLQSIYKSSHSCDGAIAIGPGDDMGMLTVGSTQVLCAVDQLIVGRHVTPDTDPRLIGRKAVARCFSDVAAMASSPVGSLMTASVPPDTPNDWCELVFQSAKEIARQWGGPIFGGDIASSTGPAMFTVTVIATPNNRAILRTGGAVGDYICVTGKLGNSIAGHHLTFTPRIEEAKELLATLGDDLHALIDISDGLGQDASHLASDQTQIFIDTSTLPLRDGATKNNAISDGEDYELLFASASIPKHPLVTVIGEIVARQSNTPSVVDENGNDLSSMGWEH